MKINVDKDVLELLKKKNKSVLTLDIRTSGGGCCPIIEISEVEMKVPKEIDNFNHIKQDDIDIYIAKKAKVLSVLQFKIEKGLFTKTVSTSGLMLKSH